MKYSLFREFRHFLECSFHHQARCLKDVSVDNIDRQILRALQNDGSLSMAALAAVVGASTASCWRRVRSLEAAGILGRTVRLVDARKVHRGVNVMCQVRLKSHAPESRRGIERLLESHEEIMECYAMSGEWDYLLRIVVADIEEYERFLMKHVLSHESVATVASNFALSQLKYSTSLPV
jgi:DNA-binding Lrp family transcriptional regulator